MKTIIALTNESWGLILGALWYVAEDFDAGDLEERKDEIIELAQYIELKLEEGGDRV